MKFLSLALTLLIATSGAAHAGPVAALFSAVAGWFATTFGAALGGFLVNTLSSIALSALSMAIRGKQQIEQPGIRTESTTAGGTIPQRLIFGRYATAGNMVAPMMVYQTDGNPNEWLVYVIALADTPTNGLGRIFVDGKPLTIDGDPAADLYGDAMGATVLETAKDSLRNKVYVRYHDGNQTAVDAYLRRVFGTYPERPWTADMVGYGVSYVVVTFKGKAKDGNYSGFPSVKFEIDGCKLRDPRTGTDVFTKSPAVIAYNILRGIDVGGETWGVGTDDFSMSHIIAAANLCDEAVPKDGGGVRARYQAGLEISVDDEPHQALLELLKAMGGDVADMGGTWLVSAGEPSGPVLAITDDDIIVTDSRTLRPYPGLAETVNAIHASYPDPAQQWEPKEAVPLYNAAYEASDGGRRLLADLNYPAVPYPMQVRALMRETLADHRRMRNHVITLPPDALGVKLGEHIAWTSVANGYIAKLFKVCAIRIDPTSLCIALTLTERDPSDYDYDPQSDGKLPTIPSSVPVVPTIEGVTGWNAMGVDAGGRPGIRMVWDSEISARAVSWSIKLDANGDEANSGTTSDILAGGVTVSAGLRANTDYRVTGRLVLPRNVTETQTIVVTTPDLRLDWSDLTGELRAELDVTAAQIDAAEAEAIAASQAAQQALADAAAAITYTDEEVAQARDDLAVDFQTAINAAGQADTAMLAAQQARDLALGAASDADDAKNLALGAVTNAQAARDAALGHKQGAETAKQAAQNAKTAAEQARALAEAKALAASNSAGAAAGSASTAASKATEAGQSASAAAAQAVIAKTGAARVLPAEITDDYWRHYLVGVPGNAGLSPQVVKNNGYVTVPASDTTNTKFISQAGLPWVAGRTYRITVTARAAQAGNWIRPLVKAYLPDFTPHSWEDAGGSLPLAGTGQWETVSIEKTLPALPDPAITQFRIGIFTVESVQPDIDIDLRSILVEDVTSEKSAAGSAAAAVQAQQAASASETAAGQQAAAAASSATTASTKAGQASTSASNAAQSETNAAGSASAAQQSATTAAGSATLAGQKATAASGSASTASTKATEAAQSATAAASSATTASTKAGEASTSADQAAQSKTDAAGSASTASNRATAAANSATQAGNSATAASGSASTASTKATEAAQSAAAASASATTASTKAGEASTSASQAAQSETNAAGSANSASISMTAAASSLSSVQTALLNTSAVVSLVPNPDVLSFSTSVTGTGALPASAYGSDADGPYVSRSATTNGAAVLGIQTVASQADSVYRVTARLKASHAMNLRLSIAWINPNGSIRTSGSYKTTSFAAGEIKTISMIIGKTAGGMVDQVAGGTHWDAAGSVRFGASVATAVAGSNFQLYSLVVDDLTAADKAAQEAGTAQGHASAAAGHAATANTKATEASQSATAAASSATTASTKAGEASTSASQAAASKTDAAGSASSAAQSATTAAGSATLAGQKATAAANSATTASTKATEASQSAAAANTSKLGADTAKAAAEVARDDSVLAKQDAQTAAASAQSSFNMSAQLISNGQGVLNDQFMAATGAWVNWNSGGTGTWAPNQFYPIGRSYTMTIANGEERGLRVENAIAAGVWKGQANANAYVVEVELTRTGNLAGAGVRLSWSYDGGSIHTPIPLAGMLAGGSMAGTRQWARAVFVRPAGATGAFLDHSLYIFAGHSMFGTIEAKTLVIHRVNIRPATAEEMGSGQVMAAVQAHLTQNYLTATQTNQAISSAVQTVSTALGQTNAAVTMNSTALSTLNGSVARFSLVTDVNGGKQAAGLEIVSFDGNGVGTGTAIVLNAMNIIAKGTLSADAAVFGLGKNLLIDPEWMDGLANWSGSLQFYAPGDVSGYANPAYPVAYMFSGAPGGGSLFGFATPAKDDAGTKALGCPVAPGETLIGSIYANAYRCSGQVYINYYDAAGSLISTIYGESTAQSFSASVPQDGWRRIKVKSTVPTGAVLAGFSIRKTGTNSGEANSYLFLWKPQLEKTNPHASKPSEWSPGGVAYINGGRLFANSILTKHLGAGAVTAEKVNTGSFAVAGLALFGGNLQSTNYNAATNTGWRITNAGQMFMPAASIKSAHIGDLEVDTIKIANGAVTKFQSAANWAGVGTDNTVSSVLVVSAPFVLAFDGLVAFKARFQPRANGGGAGSYRVYVQVGTTQLMKTTTVNPDGGVTETAGRMIYDDSTSNAHGTIHEFESPPVWFTAGSHTVQIRFVTSSYYGVLGGAIDIIRWVK